MLQKYGRRILQLAIFDSKYFVFSICSANLGRMLFGSSQSAERRTLHFECDGPITCQIRPQTFMITGFRSCFETIAHHLHNFDGLHRILQPPTLGTTAFYLSSTWESPVKQLQGGFRRSAEKAIHSGIDDLEPDEFFSPSREVFRFRI